MIAYMVINKLKQSLSREKQLNKNDLKHITFFKSIFKEEIASFRFPHFYHSPSKNGLFYMIINIICNYLIFRGLQNTYKALTKIVDEVSLGTTDVWRVLESLLKSIPKNPAKGHIIKLRDFGTYHLAIIESAPIEEEFRDTMITRNKSSVSSRSFIP